MLKDENENEIVHVYFMPGMAANATIFEHIQLPEQQFKMHFLNWFLPEKNESLTNYALRMVKHIKHENPILVGVSFGGILIQEMAKHIKTRKNIVISSVKLSKELPRRMQLAKKTKLYKMLPTGLVNNVALVAKLAFGETAKKHIDLYEKYLSVRDKYYLDWSIDSIINWQQYEVLPNTIHIHGAKDNVFPIRYINECITIPTGTHIMIINKFKWFNEHLPELMLT
ncbi:alpha/beta hydrolase [Zhouia sp. PK063]|uniref:alpha/beta hydrolase n=1 Tax=Zhouia sp. PK063 TaxID=3373602 RepID=UPI00379BC2B4